MISFVVEIADLNSHATIEKWTASRFVAACIYIMQQIQPAVK